MTFTSSSSAHKNRKSASLVVEEIRQGGGYGMDSEILVRLSHPLFKGTLTRTVKRRDLPELYKQLLGAKAKSGSSYGSINASDAGLIDAIIDGAHMDIVTQSKMAARELDIRTPDNMKQVEEELGTEYVRRKSMKLTST